jgi:hypothetical protein
MYHNSHIPPVMSDRWFAATMVFMIMAAIVVGLAGAPNICWADHTPFIAAVAVRVTEAWATPVIGLEFIRWIVWSPRIRVGAAVILVIGIAVWLNVWVIR